jgi:hypothetical protein
VDTKFAENHKGILAELLPIAAPMAVGSDESRFEARFGFLFKQPLVRMRFLDEKLMVRLGFVMSNFAIPLDEFKALPFGGNTVLVVENEMTFLTLPSFLGTIAIFGAGDAAALLSTVTWLNSCRVFYWGDLDSHGFEILSNFRKSFPHVTSVLMDEMTYSNHSTFIVKAASTRTKGKLELTENEMILYNRLVEEKSLLEQERISNVFSAQLLSRILIK